MTTAQTPDDATIGDQAEEWLANQQDDSECAEDSCCADTEETEESATDPLAEATQKIAELEDQLARAKADTYNVQQEYNNYVRRAKNDIPQHRQSGQAEVVEALLPALDDVHAARSHGQLEDGPFAAIAKKIEDALANRMKLEIYGVAGDLFDPTIHEALMAEENNQVTEATVAQVLQPGYKIGERILRPARVIVHNPV